MALRLAPCACVLRVRVCDEMRERGRGGELASNERLGEQRAGRGENHRRVSNAKCAPRALPPARSIK